MHPLKSFDKWLRQQPEEYSKEIAISIARMLMPNSQLNGDPIDALLQWCAEVQEDLSIVGRSMSIRSAFDYLFLPYINDGVWEALEYQSESFRAHAVDDANLTMIGFFDRNIGGIHARRA